MYLFSKLLLFILSAFFASICMPVGSQVTHDDDSWAKNLIVVRLVSYKVWKQEEKLNGIKVKPKKSYIK